MGSVRFFLGYDDVRSSDTIDDDTKTVWTNLSPFITRQGSKDLPKELMVVGVESTLELITILQPKRILLLGTHAFQILEEVACLMVHDCDVKIEHLPVLEHVRLEIGRINNASVSCVAHPRHQWALADKYFTSIFLLLHRLIDVQQDGAFVHSLQDVRKKMRATMQGWLSKIEIND